MPHTVSLDRRRLLGRIALGAAALPLLRLSPVRADDLPHLSPDDPSAKPLHYIADASKIDPRAEQTYTAGSRCGTCALFHADKAKGDWSSCDIFTTKAVNSHGWCLSYTSG